MSENNFTKLAAINVSQHIEKKNGLSYLSWPFAVSELMKADPMANWEFHEPVRFGESMMVSCTVTAFGKPVTMHLPVMDHRNQAIKNPDAFAVNKNMMRCLVKAIACHGLGLYIYAGEDLPEGEKTTAVELVESRKSIAQDHFDKMDAEEQAFLREQAQSIKDWFGSSEQGGFDAYREVTEKMDSEEKIALWSLLPSNIRTSIKKQGEKKAA